MLNADQLQVITLAMAAGTFLVSLIMLSVLLRRSRSAQTGEAVGSAQSRQIPAPSAAEEQQLVAVITAAIAAAQADEGGDQHLAAAIAAAVSANRTASGSTAGFVIRKIRRV